MKDLIDVRAKSRVKYHNSMKSSGHVVPRALPLLGILIMVGCIPWGLKLLCCSTCMASNTCFPCLLKDLLSGIGRNITIRSDDSGYPGHAPNFWRKPYTFWILWTLLFGKNISEVFFINLMKVPLIPGFWVFFHSLNFFSVYEK